MALVVVARNRETPGAGAFGWLTPRRLVALWTPPTASPTVRWTAPLRGAFAETTTIETAAGVTAPATERTASGLGATLFAYGYIFARFVSLVAYVLQSRNVHRKQAAAIVLGGLFPTVGATTSPPDSPSTPASRRPRDR